MNEDQNQEHEYQDQPSQSPEAAPVADPDLDGQPEDTLYKWPVDQPVDQPVVQPVAIVTPDQVVSEAVQLPVVADKPVNDPAVIVLQWLTYAFWGWTVLAMSFLVVAVVSFFVNQTNIVESLLYGVAAVLVLLPISVICDIFYSKHEPEKKSGAAAVFMVIHAVIFALFAIGSLIAAVFSLVSLMISSSETNTTLIMTYSSLIIAFLYGIVFLRTILPKMLFRFRRHFIILMAVIVGVIIAAGFLGPIADARLTRTDKLIESNLPTVGQSINSYVSTNNRLPNDLSALTLTGDAKKLVTDNLVTFKKDSGPQTKQTFRAEDTTAGSFYYQLCVTYKKAAESQYTPSSYDSSNNGYLSYITTDSHAAGDVCYKVEAMNYNNIYDGTTRVLDNK